MFRKILFASFLLVLSACNNERTKYIESKPLPENCKVYDASNYKTKIIFIECDGKVVGIK